MKKLIPLFLFVILAFVTCQNASAFTISAIPQKQEFTANDWIKINQAIRYMVNQGLIKTPSINQNDNVQIPNWLKGNVEK